MPMEFCFHKHVFFTCWYVVVNQAIAKRVFWTDPGEYLIVFFSYIKRGRERGERAIFRARLSLGFREGRKKKARNRPVGSWLF